MTLAGKRQMHTRIAPAVKPGPSGQIENGDARKFVLAGRAAFTLENTATGNAYAFKVTRSDDGRAFFVRARHVRATVGDAFDYGARGAFIGTVFADGERFQFSTRKAELDRTATPVRVFEWAWNRIRLGKLDEPIALWHEGACGACGRALTDPESIRLGLGPTCAKRSGAEV